jgi:2-succinyl-6-hydroxy-2,4-cyclohexadiene-1-carboxylate synthase
MATTTIFGVPHYYSLTANSAADPLVFIHGWLLSHKYWHPVIDELGPEHPCLTYDLRGFGESRHHLQQFLPGLPPLAQGLAASTSPYSLAAYARDLAELLQQLNLKPAWLVGHSLGGSIALWTAYCYPHLVKGVICLNAGGGIYIEREFRQFRQLGQQILKFRFPWLRHLPFIPLMFSRSMVAQPLPYQWGVERLQDLLKADFDAAIGTLLETTTEAEVHLLPRIVASLQQPIRFLGGSHDPVMDLKFVNHLASYHSTALMDGPLVTELPDCGHMAMLEQPKLVVQAVKDFITGQTRERHPLDPYSLTNDKS